MQLVMVRAHQGASEMKEKCSGANYLSGLKLAQSLPQLSSSLWLVVGDTQTEWSFGMV